MYANAFFIERANKTRTNVVRLGLNVCSPMPESSTVIIRTGEERRRRRRMDDIPVKREIGVKFASA